MAKRTAAVMSKAHAGHSILTSRHAILASAVPVGLIAAGLYFSTLMRTVSGCGHAYCADVGEFQVALAEWGTVHHTGYPLYMWLGSPFVAALRALGVPPAAGASAYSLVWEVIAVLGFTTIVARLTGKPWLALGVGLLLTVMRPIWVHGSLAEVYSLSMAITAAILWITFDLSARWSDRAGWLLAFLAGLGVAHHRLIALLLPAVSLGLLRAARRSPNFGRWLALSAGFFLAGFLPYVDMPLRVWHGATWVYGRPDTWAGFWFLFRGDEGLQPPRLDPAAIGQAMGQIVRLLTAELTGPGLIAATLGFGAALGVKRSRPTAALLLGILAAYLFFATVFQSSVLLEADLMTVLVILAIGLALAMSQLPAKVEVPLSIGLTVWAAYLGARNYPFVVGLTGDPGGQNYIRKVGALDAPPGSIVMAPWGPSYFALAYAQRVEGAMPDWTIVDHRADLAGLARSSTGRVYTAAETLYVFDPGWWSLALGRPLRITSAGPGLVALSAQPLDSPRGNRISLGDGLALAGWEVRPSDPRDEAHVILYWVAKKRPSIDYSTFVYATDQDAIQMPEDLIAQSDSVHPVYGWYPTSRWRRGEMVREDHLLMLPGDRPVRTLVVGMYSRDAAGNFAPLGQVALTRTDGRWVARP